MKSPSNLYVVSLILNVIGILISFAIGKVHDAGGGSLGYVIVGLGITGALTLLIALAATVIYGRKMFKSGGKTAIAIVLLILSIWEISFVFYLELW